MLLTTVHAIRPMSTIPNISTQFRELISPCSVPEKGFVNELSSVLPVYIIFLVIIPLGHKPEGELEAHTGKSLIFAVVDGSAASLAGDIVAVNSVPATTSTAAFHTA